LSLFTPVVAVLAQIGNDGPQLGHQGVRCGAGFRSGFRSLTSNGAVDGFRPETMAVGFDIAGKLSAIDTP
jgi:hypothetical protein